MSQERDSRMIYDYNDLIGFVVGIGITLPALYVGVFLMRSSDVSASLKSWLEVSLTLCLIPFLLFAVAEFARFFVHYDEGGPLLLIVFIVAPIGLLAGNAIAVICLLLNLGSNARHWCRVVALTNIVYLLFGMLVISNARM